MQKKRKRKGKEIKTRQRNLNAIELKQNKRNDSQDAWVEQRQRRKQKNLRKAKQTKDIAHPRDTNRSKSNRKWKISIIKVN